MSYQPNDFVNPYQRSVQLPAECKDLNDVLQKMGAQKRPARPIFPVRHGSLADIPRYVQEVYMEHPGLSLAVTIRAAQTVLWVHNRRGGCRLSFLQRKQHTKLGPVVQGLFGNIGLNEEANEDLKLMTAPLPHLWLEAAQIVQSIIRGYDVPENTDLLFHFARGRG